VYKSKIDNYLKVTKWSLHKTQFNEGAGKDLLGGRGDRCGGSQAFFSTFLACDYLSLELLLKLKLYQRKTLPHKIKITAWQSTSKQMGTV
jgi:hypothetical protein